MDLMMRRNALLACGKRNRLPSAYQEVEYIASTGTQAILTDIPCQLPLKTDIDIMFTTNNNSYFCGTQYGGVRICSGGNYSRYIHWAFRKYQNDGNIDTNVRYLLSTTLENGNQSVRKDGNAVISKTLALTEAELSRMSGNLGLFAMWYNDTQSFTQFAKARCYGVKISSADNLLGDFIPCYRKSDGEIGMYDTVSKTFYTNAGTGTFLKGADV